MKGCRRLLQELIWENTRNDTNVHFHSKHAKSITFQDGEHFVRR